jgi:peroxiredoxin
MLALGTPAPPFSLPDAVSGRTVSLEDFREAPALLVAFICNHCPFVRHIADGFGVFGRAFVPRGLAIVAISSNDVTTHPEDAPPAMAQLAKAKNFVFPYLYDESQAVALAYEAVCTPDFFLFDRDRRLVYRGQFDASRPGNGMRVTGKDLRAAAEAVLSGTPVSGEQVPSIGCSIKWKPGRAPDWA